MKGQNESEEDHRRDFLDARRVRVLWNFHDKPESGFTSTPDNPKNGDPRFDIVGPIPSPRAILGV